MSILSRNKYCTPNDMSHIDPGLEKKQKNKTFEYISFKFDSTVNNCVTPFHD